MNLETSQLNLKLVPNLALKAVYKSRYTRQLVTLENPSEAHLKRLFNTGHDILLQYFDGNEIVKTEVWKY